MERFGFGPDDAFVPGGDLLEDVTVAPLTAPLAEGSGIQAAVFRIAPGGRLLRHPATHPQVLAVLDGSGTVSGADGVEQPIGAGEAVFWAEGEEHETRSAEGMTALVVEGLGLARWKNRRP